MSLGMQATRDGTPLHSDASDAEDESPAEGPDASIRPYLKQELESYDQGDITEDVSPDGDAEAKELEVGEAVEEDAQSATAEEVLEIPKSSQPVEPSDINQEPSVDTEILDIASETVILEEPTPLRTPSPAPSPAPCAAPSPTPSPARQANVKTSSVLISTGKKYQFPKFTPVEVFENYIQNPGELTYKELYHKASKIAEVLIAYQDEYDGIDQEIIQYEAVIKAEARRAVEDAKEEADRNLELEDMARDELQEKYHDKLLLKQRDWQIFLTGLASKRSTNAETLRHLNSLRNPVFMDAVKKRRNRTAPRAARRLQDEPVPEYKLTKEEHDFEKRKLGRLLDPVRFEDVKMADVYGFEYSAHPSHHGNQPLDRMTRQPQKYQRKSGDSNGISGSAPSSAGRLRAQRTKTKRLYDVDDSATSDGDEEVPAKRARRPKVFEDGATASPRVSPQNFGIIPAAKRTFPSGKRVGRPPKAYSQSKLQAVQTVQELPELAPDIQGAQLGEYTAEPVLASPTELTAVKRKHPGGRPRKILEQPLNAPVDTPKPRNKGGRPRKNRTRETTPSQGGTVQVSAIKDELGSAANIIQLGEADDVMQSTEVDEASRVNSPATSRPTTSSSSDTASSFGGGNARRSARASTRTKTLAREQSTRSMDDDMMANVDNPILSSASSSRDKRKRGTGTADTEPSPIIVEAPFQFDEPTPKRRRTKAPKAEASEELAAEMGQRRKRKSGATHGESVAKRPKKSILDSADAGDDYDGELPLSPLARKELAAKKAQSEKSKKLSISTKARWASGGMAKAQETRRANLAIKKAAKEAAAAAAAAAASGSPSSNLVPIQPAPFVPFAAPAEPDPTSPRQQKAPRQKTPPIEGGRPPSTRVKKPTRIAAGLDDVVDDFDDELDEDFPSEYDRYQALTSAGSPGLGKRVRRPLVDLSAMMGETSDEDYY